ncbi:MAG: hypothetical protein HOE82_05645 [Gammaproteobacteria bacterium]|jgi:hypothetical protein|nr:hypothetical protein [Gammaproteobacteria bacterium]
MVDYELTMIQSWINYIFDELERQNKLSMLPHQVVTNRAETKKIIAEQRVEYKKQTEELRKQEEAMKIKQEELDAEESTKITEESTINEQPIINQEELSEGEGLDVKDL